MGRDQSDAGQYEWVNVWAATSGTSVAAATVAAPPPEPPPAKAVAPFVEIRPLRADIVPEPANDPPPARSAAHFVAAKAGGRILVPLPAMVATALPHDQLMRDIADIERARDALAAGPIGRRVRAFLLVPARSADSAPLMIGGALALAMLVALGATAAITKLGR